MPKEDRHVLRFVNPVVDSDDEDDNILEPERSFCDFNTFVNQWWGVQKKIKQYLILHSGSSFSRNS